jgi:prepilin-type N-terminal cleavage/methylation domain-containing protein
MSKSSRQESGFTLVEILVVLAIIAMLFGLSTINLGKASADSSLHAVVSQLKANLKSQQIKAMSGDKGGTNSQQPQGIHFGNSSYTLFSSANYSATDPNNYTTNTNSVTITTTLPNNQITFAKASGQVTDFTSGKNTITVNKSGTKKQLTINRLGAITVQKL